MTRPTPASLDTLPLHELLAFEATARLGTIARAAEELSVTASALSHRLASLQARLGTVLLERHGKGLRLTPEGARHLGGMQAALQALAARGEALRTQEHGLVRVAAAPAIATGWLLPLLAPRLAADPGLRIELATVALAEDAAGLDWDLLVHYGEADGSEASPGAQRVPLFADVLLPVCAPALLPGGAPPADLDAFARLPLLRHTLLNWSRWIEGAFGARREWPVAAYFDDAPSMLEAAAGGAGVALATGLAAAPYLARGALVAAHPFRLSDRAFYAELSESGQHKPRARALLEALQAQAATRVA